MGNRSPQSSPKLTDKEFIYFHIQASGTKPQDWLKTPWPCQILWKEYKLFPPNGQRMARTFQQWWSKLSFTICCSGTVSWAVFEMREWVEEWGQHHTNLAQRSKVIILGATIHQNTDASLYVKQWCTYVRRHCVLNSEGCILNSEHHCVFNRKHRSNLKPDRNFSEIN